MTEVTDCQTGGSRSQQRPCGRAAKSRDWPQAMPSSQHPSSHIPASRCCQGLQGLTSTRYPHGCSASLLLLTSFIMMSQASSNFFPFELRNAAVERNLFVADERCGGGSKFNSCSRGAAQTEVCVYRSIRTKVTSPLVVITPAAIARLNGTVTGLSQIITATDVALPWPLRITAHSSTGKYVPGRTLSGATTPDATSHWATSRTDCLCSRRCVVKTCTEVVTIG